LDLVLLTPQALSAMNKYNVRREGYVPVRRSRPNSMDPQPLQYRMFGATRAGLDARVGSVRLKSDILLDEIGADHGKRQKMSHLRVLHVCRA